MIVYKYPVTPNAVTAVSLPFGSKILSCGFQGDRAFIWALVPYSAIGVNEIREVIVVGNGIEDIPVKPNDLFIGTAFYDWMVFHFFEKVKDN